MRQTTFTDVKCLSACLCLCGCLFAQSQDVSTVSSGRNGTTATTRVRIPSRKSSTQNAYLETPLETPLEGKKIDWSSGVDKDADYKNMSKDDLIKRSFLRLEMSTHS